MDKQKLLSKATLFTINGNKEARLKLSGYKNFLRLMVFTGEIGKTPKMQLHLPVNRIALQIVVEKLKDLNNQVPGYDYKVEVRTPVWENEKMTRDTKLSGYIVLGRRDIDGEIINYLGVEDAEGKKYYFKLLPSPYVKFFKNGKPVTETEASEDWTIGYANTLDKVLNAFPELLDDEESDFNSNKPLRQGESDKKNSKTTDASVDDFDKLF